MVARLKSSPHEFLVNAVQELSLARNIDTVMRIVRSAARELTGADGATFILRDGNFCYYADEDAISPLWKGNRFPLETCISGWVMINKKSTIINDIYADSRIPHDAYRPTFVKSLAMVPIRTVDPIGAIGNYWASHYEPTEEQVSLLQSLANITAVTIENIKMYEELEQRVKKRTEQFEAANRELQVANQELETLAYSLSHDLRSPLRTISLSTEKLLREFHPDESDPARRLTDKVFLRINTMQALMENLLMLFKMGRKSLNVSNVSMSELVKEVFEELRDLEPQRKITLSISNLPDVMADKTLIRQVWQNLISNALKYTKTRDHTEIHIGFQQEYNSAAYYIADNGVGFNMKYNDKMFQPFQRFHNRDEFDGSGIGLAITERIIARHNGKLWAKGEPDKGATFYFSIPG